MFTDRRPKIGTNPPSKSKSPGPPGSSKNKTNENKSENKTKGGE